MHFIIKIFPVLLLLTALFAVNQSFGQSRNSIGIGAGINMPLQDGYRVGRHRVVQANLFSKNRWSLMPTLGWETIAGGHKGIDNGSYYSESKPGADLVLLNLAGKYYFSNRWFAYAGPSVYLGSYDGGTIDWGGTLGAGYDWAFDDYSSVEFSLRTDILPVNRQTIPVAGFRVAYKFNFSRKY
jgi:hypothetical protein